MDRIDYYLMHEEKPLVELPTLIWALIIFMSFGLVVSLLFLPWYLSLVVFFALTLIIGIILNPFIAVPIYLIGAFIRPMQFAPGLVKYQLPVIGAFAVLLAWLFHIMIYRDFKFPKSSQWKFLFFFTVILIFSSLPHWEYSYFSFFDLIKVIILYFLVANLVKTEKQIKIVLFFMLFLGVITAFFGIYQQTHGLGGILRGGITRAEGFEGNPNYLAMDLVILIPVVLCLFVRSGKILLKTLFLSIFILFLTTIMLTYSRAGALGSSVVLFLIFWRFFNRRQKIAYFFLAIALMLILLPYIPTAYIERIKSIVNLGEVSIRGRIDGLIVGFWMMKDHPFLGVGVGRWGLNYWQKAITLPYVQTKFSKWAHNIFIEIGAQLGIPALIFFLFLLLYLFKDLIFSRKIFLEKKELFLSTIAQALEIGLVGFLSCALFAQAVHLKLFWMLAGLSVSLKQIALTYRER